MAGTCTASVSPNNCSHRTISQNLDGETVTVDMTEAEAQAPLTVEEKQLALRLNTRRRCQLSIVTLANLVDRVLVGDEATNVKAYTFFGPGAAITKMNIGTTYVNIPPGLNGERILVDFTGCTEFRAFMNANLVATGPFQVRIVRDGDSELLFESPSLTQTGERELDSGWTALPAAFANAGQVLLRIQAKSTTSTDDPTFRRAGLMVR